MEEGQSCTVHYLNGAFLIFDPRHALELRIKKIVSQSIGGGNTFLANGPYHISTYAAYVMFKENLAVFKTLELKNNFSLEQNKVDLDAKIAHAIDRETKLFNAQRLEELKKRNIPVTIETMKQFDRSKLRLVVTNMPDEKCSLFNERLLSLEDVVSILDKYTCDKLKVSIFNDMYRRGFYVSSGMKFGCDFLAYIGDPVRYHARFAIKHVHSTSDGYVDLSMADYNILNGFQRLTHTANKIPLFATVVLETNSDNIGLNNLAEATIRYWTLKEREYLTPGSKNTDFESLDPNPSSSNKIRRTL